MNSKHWSNQTKISINQGFTNTEKYRMGNKFILHKTNNGFNHAIDYQLLSQFDFVPKLIKQTEHELVWEFIEGEELSKPTNEDLAQLGKIIRIIHKSDLKFPKNNLRKRVHAYLKIIHDKKIHIPEIENNYRPMSKLLSRMGRLNPCHNDLWWQNILKDQNGKLWLVDWEYATMGDKHFDLEYLIESFPLTTNQAKIFLEAYDATDDYRAYIEEWRPQYKKLVNWITLCWAYAQPEIPFSLDKIKATLR